MKHVGLLTVRNEVDVIDEFLDDVEKWFDDIVVMDDSTDGTCERIAKRSVVKYLVKFSDVYDPEGPRRDGQKQHLFEHVCQRWGFGTWITVLNADAFFGDDPNKAVELAQAQDMYIVQWVVFNHFPHQEDEAAYLADKDAWLALPVRERLTWVQDYRWVENLQFRTAKGQYFNVNEHRRIIPRAIPATYPDVNPVLLHYPLRSPEQIVKRRADRLETGFRDDRYFAPWIENGGFVRPAFEKLWPQMKRWDDTGVDLFATV